MSSVFDKLNLGDRNPILVLNAPPEFQPELESLHDVNVHASATGRTRVDFVLVFAIRLRELNDATNAARTRTSGDSVVWVAYPKKSSKNYTCEFDRDSGWDALGAAGFEPVRMVAIDEDWSALRFRRVEFIKSLKRDPKHAISKAGKKRTAGDR